MILIRSIYRLLTHYFMFVCFVFAAFGMGFSLIFFLGDNEQQLSDYSEYDGKIVIWSSDYHISPIRDLKHLLIPLGVRFIDKSLSSSCSLTETCATDLRILSSVNGINPNNAIRKRFYEYYKNDPLMRLVDVFVCFYPAAMCELFIPFNRTIIVIATTRYEFGRFSALEWKQWNKNLHFIASNPRNIVAANNRYDAEYIRYFTGINATILPSICAYTNVVYRPTKTHPEYIFIPSHENIDFNQQFLDELNFSIKKSNTSIIVKSLRQLYKFYNYSDLIRHPAIIYLPYQVSTTSLFEQYTMNIPLFFPSINLLTEWHLKYNIVYERTWDRILTGVGKNHSTISSYNKNSIIPDPNNEYDYSSVHYWLKYSDFYQWPYITYFKSIDDLIYKLIHTNLTSISEQMSQYNHKKRFDLLENWKTILNHIYTSSYFSKKKKSL